MKKLLTIILLITLIFSFACDKKSKEKTESESVTLTVAFGATGTEFQVAKKNCEKWADSTGNQVEMFQSPNMSNDRLGLFQQFLGAKSDEIDVMQIDVVWPGLLGNHFINLKEYIPQSHIDNHFDALVENNTVNDGKLVAIPLFTDAGVLYYRKDLLEKYDRTPPETWEALKETATYIVEQEKDENPDLVGFVFQGKAYEGLTCNALEWIVSYNGGTIISDTGEITINNPQAIKALKMAASWIGTISPKGVLNYTEEDARGVFQSGNAVFMRNWPYAWTLAQNPDSPVKGNIGVVALPKGGEDGMHAATFGGWSLAIPKYSEHPKEAADLVRYLTTPEKQLERAIEIAKNPTIPSVYKAPTLKDANPFMVKLTDTFTNAVARPSDVTGNDYNKVSNKFWNAVHATLSGRKSAEAALAELETELTRIKAQGAW